LRAVRRLAPIALASLLWVVPAQASASYAPKLVVSNAPGGAVRVGIATAQADDPTARMLVYVPSSYRIAAPAPGSRLGAATATATDPAGGVLPLTGELGSVTASDLTAAAQAALAACSELGPPSQIWDLRLSAPGLALDVPLAVLPATADEAAAGYGAKLCAVLAPPGERLLSATFTCSAIVEPRAGDARWTSVWTPYAPGTAQPNPAGSVESQALRHVPVTLTTTVGRRRVATRGNVATAVRFSSTVRENGRPPSSTVIRTSAQGRRVGGARGTLLLSRIRATRLTVTAAVDSDSGSVATGRPPRPGDLFFHDLGAPSCTSSPMLQGLPCVDATVGGERLTESVAVRAFTR
jgi:hypothetical protein